MGRNEHDTAEVAAEAHRAGVITSIGYNYRGVPAVEHLKTLIAAGALGRITNVRSVFFSGYAAQRSADGGAWERVTPVDGATFGHAVE